MIDDGNIEYFWAVCFAFGFAVIIWSYFLSFFFKQSWNAQILVFLLSITTGLFLAIIVWVFKMIPGMHDTAKVSEMVLRILPPYCLGSSIITITNKPMNNKTYGYPKDEMLSSWSWEYGADLYYLIVEFFVYSFFVYVMEQTEHMQFFSNFWVKAKNLVSKDSKFDVDV